MYESVVICFCHTQDLVLRLCFVLGNLAALNEEARHTFYELDNAVVSLINALEHYLQLFIKVSLYFL